MKYWKWYLFGGLSSASFIISLVAICSCEKYTFDKTSLLMSGFSFVVSSLTIVVTVLLGWQIFNIINLGKIKDSVQNQKEEIKNLHDSMLSKTNKNILIMSMSMAEFYTSQYLDTDCDKEPEKAATLFYGAILNKAMAIELCAAFNEVDMFNSLIKTASLIVNDMELQDKDKAQILGILSRIPDTWKTSEFVEFVNNIVS